MTQNPKFAHLSGIAFDQPDVFETSDLPEVDQYISEPVELYSESVTNVQINTDEAFKRFQGTTLTSADVDFSDRITPTRRTGYEIDFDMEEEQGGEEMKRALDESLVERFSRLRHELDVLVGEATSRAATALSSSGGSGSGDGDAADGVGLVTPDQLVQLSEALQAQLKELELEKVVGPDGGLDLCDSEGVLHKRLLDHVGGFEADKAGRGGGKQGDVAIGDGRVVYELIANLDVSKAIEQAKLAELTGRLEQLERLLGKKSVGSSQIPEGQSSVLEWSSRLWARSSLLDPGHLEQVEARLAALYTRLQEPAEKREVPPPQPDTQAKIAELYELVKKWDSVIDSLPTMVERLTALQDFHEEALQFSQAVNTFDINQQQLSSVFQAHQDLVNKLQYSLKESVTTVKTNCDVLSNRLQNM